MGHSRTGGHSFLSAGFEVILFVFSTSILSLDLSLKS